MKISARLKENDRRTQPKIGLDAPILSNYILNLMVRS
jgi:hypothetical protein